MIRSQLNSYSGSDPIWGFVALVRSEQFTGEAAVGIDPRVRLFAVDGRIYFAEREGDAPIGTRLVNYGSVTNTQLEHGAVRIGESSSLARLFQRDPTIDRDAVELTIELTTESLLESIANKPVGMPEVFPLRHHSSGIHHWLKVGAPNQAVATEDTPVAEDVPDAEVEPPFAETHVVLEDRVGETATIAEDDVVSEWASVADDAPAFEEASLIAEVAEVAEVEEVAAVREVEEFVAEAAGLDFEETPVTEAAPIAEEAADDEALHEFEQPPVAEAWSASSMMASAPHQETMADTGYDMEPPAVSEPEPIVAETAEVELVRAYMPWATGAAIEHSEPAPAESFAEVEYDSPAELSHDELPHDELPHDELPHDDAPNIEAPASIAGLFSLPAPHGAASLPAPTAPWVEEHPHANGVNGHTPHITIETVAEEQPAPDPIPTVAPIPTLPSLATLGSWQRPAADAAPDAGLADSLPPAVSYEPATPPPDLPKLASAPISMSDPAAANAEPPSPWPGATHNLAAVDIWEMVDDLTIDHQVDDEQLVSSGGADKRGRGWLKGRKD